MSKQPEDKLAQMGFSDLHELLLYLPFKYHDFRVPITSLEQAIEASNDGQEAVYLRLKVTEAAQLKRSAGPGPDRVVIGVTDGAHQTQLSAFGHSQDWKERGVQGRYLHLLAKVTRWKELYWDIKSPTAVRAHEQNRIVPRYRARAGVNSEQIEQLVEQALSDPACLGRAVADIKARTGVSAATLMADAGGEGSLEALLRTLHRPQSGEALQRATAVARRVNALESVYASRNEPAREPDPRAKVTFSVDDIRAAVYGLGFQLTNDQRRAIWEICQDLFTDRPMRRLLSGDVGCGKTLGYAVPAVCAQRQGAQVGIMMPNAMLASQVAEEIEAQFPGTPVRLVLGGERKHDTDLSQRPILVGTSALRSFRQAVEKEQGSLAFDFLIIDEQQKLGVGQREALMSPHTNLLEATATPIPRTAALILFGDMAFSRIDTSPVTKNIHSEIIGPDKHRQASGELIDIVRAGGQIAIVYPMRDRPPEREAIEVPAERADTAVETLKAWGAKSVRALDPDSSEAPSSTVEITYKAAKKHRERIDEGIDQAGWRPVDPRISAHEQKRASANVEDAWEKWNQALPGQIGRIHGAMSNRDKLAELEKARSGAYRGVVTTSVIEIGLTLPELQGLTVVDSDRHGASTLHQFRGRLARRGGPGTFYMHISRPLGELNPDSAARLRAVAGCENGRELARLDMEQRGFGDLTPVGASQAGFLDGIFRGLKVTPADLDALVAVLETRAERKEPEESVMRESEMTASP